jgi:hypothetical protein
VADEQSQRNGINEVVEGLRAIVLRIADFFDILDLSFIISGAVALAAISFWAWRAEVPMPPLPEGWIRNIALILASYVLGLLCFAIGRWFRGRWRADRVGGKVNDRFLEVLEAHGLSEIQAVSEYLRRGDARGEARLYVRLWAEVRQSHQLAASFYLLRRYWVMAATYDGMVTALLVWILTIAACVLGLGNSPPIPITVGLTTVIALAASALACSREAGRYVDYQMEELVASIAASRNER